MSCCGAVEQWGAGGVKKGHDMRGGLLEQVYINSGWSDYDCSSQVCQ